MLSVFVFRLTLMVDLLRTGIDSSEDQSLSENSPTCPCLSIANSMSASQDKVANTVRIEQTTPIIRQNQNAIEVNGQHAEVLVLDFSDFILVNVTMEGKIGHMVFPFSLVLS
jgi:hypothetical protein